MTLSLLLLLAPFVDIRVELQLPIPMCVPEIVGVDGRPLTFPENHPLVFHFADEPVRIVIASSCHAPRWICLGYQIFCNSACVYAAGSPPARQGEVIFTAPDFCDSFCVFTVGGRTARIDEIGEDEIVFTVPERCWSHVGQVTCRIEYRASSMADMTGDCRTTAWDARRLIEGEWRNRLEIWRYLQNEWSVASNTQAEWNRERVAPDPDPDGIEPTP